MAVRLAAQLGRSGERLLAPDRGELGDIKRLKRCNAYHESDANHARSRCRPLHQRKGGGQQQRQTKELLTWKGQPPDRPKRQLTQRQQAAQYQ